MFLRPHGIPEVPHTSERQCDNASYDANEVEYDLEEAPGDPQTDGNFDESDDEHLIISVLLESLILISW